MSILIKGIDLPESCRVCKFNDYNEWDDTWCMVTEKDIEHEARNERRRSKDCPLVPIPEHGRLGDLDDFAKRMKNLVEKAEDDGFDLGAVWYSEFVRHVELTPTIIPAEEDE